MWIKGKIPGLLLVLFCIEGAFFLSSIAVGEVTNYYSNNAEINPVAFTLTISNPTEQTTYSKLLPVQFSLIWNVSLESLLNDHQPVKGYAYRIDDNPLVNVTPNGSLAVPRKESYWFNYSVDISDLAQGNHKISVTACQYYGNSSYQGLFNQSSTPIAFSVDNTLPLPTPTATVTTTPPASPNGNPPHAGLLDYLLPLSMIVAVIVVFSFLLYRWHKKNR